MLKARIQDYVSPKDLEWWDSTTDVMQPQFEAGTVSFWSSGALPSPQGEQESGKKKRILKVKVGAIERVPKELKHLDTSKQVS